MLLNTCDGPRCVPRPSPSGPPILEPALGVEGGHAPRPRGRDRLAVDVVLDVAAGEHPVDAGARALEGPDVAVLLELELTLEQRRCSARGRWPRTGRSRRGSDSAPVTVSSSRTPATFVSPRTSTTGRVPGELDARVGERPLLHDLRGAQLVPPVDEGHRGGEAREEDRLFEGRVAPADHGDVLVAEEEAVAGGAGGDPVAEQAGLVLGTPSIRDRAPVATIRASVRVGGLGRRRIADPHAERGTREIDPA